MLAAHPAGTVWRALGACELANERFRFRDIDCDHVHLQEGGKDIDVFTEHVVELQLARRHVRVCDDARCMDLEAVRVRVRDVDRRRARVADSESVMNVLTESVKVSDLVDRRLRAVCGGLSWSADAREVSFNETKQERVEFGDLTDEAAFGMAADPEPVVTLPDDDVDAAPAPTPADGDDRVTIEEVEVDDEGDARVTNAPEPGAPKPDAGDEQPFDEVFVEVSDLPPRCRTDLPQDELIDTKCSQKPSLERKWSRRNRAGSSWFVDMKPQRRRSRKLPLRRHQSASACVK